jgi:hypothetical protein
LRDLHSNSLRESDQESQEIHLSTFDFLLARFALGLKALRISEKGRDGFAAHFNAPFSRTGSYPQKNRAITPPHLAAKQKNPANTFVALLIIFFSRSVIFFHCLRPPRDPDSTVRKGVGYD